MLKSSTEDNVIKNKNRILLTLGERLQDIDYTQTEEVKPDDKKNLVGVKFDDKKGSLLF